jgi:hypothetical protein
MWILFWFVIVSLACRRLLARSELYWSLGNPGMIAALDRLEADLKNNNFRTTKSQIDDLRSDTEKTAPICHEMLKIVKNELEIRQNHSLPDALLVWTQSLREELSSSRWLLGWCGRALPTVGFIYKVFGIALAMKDSDTIALANGSLDQAAAIASVSGSLGLAFSATFVAFLLSLAIGLLDAWEAHYERFVVTGLESRLVRLLTVPPAAPAKQAARAGLAAI